MKKFNKKDLIYFIIILTISMLIFIPFLRPHFSTDSYYIANKGYKNYAINNSLKDGRLIMALIGEIAELTSVPINTYIVVLTILALITNCLAVIILKNIIINFKNTTKIWVEILIILISYFTIFNFTYIENMVYVECFVMSLSILFYLISANEIVNKNNRYHIMTGMLLLLLGTISYQGTISMYLISLFVFSFIKNKNYKNIIIDFIKGIIILAFAIFIQVIIFKINEKFFYLEPRAVSIKSLIYNMHTTLSDAFELVVNTGFVYTKYMYLIFVAITEIIVLIKTYKEKLNEKILINQILIIIFSILFGLSVSFIRTSGFYGARCRYSIGATIGFLLIHLYCKTDLLDDIKNKINQLLILVFITYSITIVANYVDIMNNTLEVNKRDKEMALEIVNYVENYEMENNCNVNNLAIFHGKIYGKGFYTDLKSIPGLSWSSIKTQWSIEGTLEMYSNRDFCIIEPNQENLNYFLDNVDIDKDYTCIDDTLYIRYYIK